MKTSVARPLYCSGVNKGVGSTAQTFIATFDRHSLLVWRVGDDIYQPLNLRHTKPFTVGLQGLGVQGLAVGHGGCSGWMAALALISRLKCAKQSPSR